MSNFIRHAMKGFTQQSSPYPHTTITNSGLAVQPWTFDEQTVRGLLKLQKLLAGLALLMGGLELLPWLAASWLATSQLSHWALPIATSIPGGSLPAAGGIIAAALSLLLPSKPFRYWLGTGMLVCLISLSAAFPAIDTLVEVFFTSGAPSGQLLGHYWTAGTALCLVLFGSSLFIFRLTPAFWAGPVLAYGLFLVAYIALLAFIMGQATFPGVAAYALLPPHRAVAFLGLSAALLAGHPAQGIARVFSSPYAGSRYGKKAFTGMLTSPLALALVVALLLHYITLTAEFGIVLFFVVYFTASLTGAYFNFSQLNAFDLERVRLLEKNQAINGQLAEANQRSAQANQQLIHTNGQLKQAHEEAVTLTEELTATNEELSSTMEELQVTNEQLLEANQEIQALMEERLHHSELKFGELTESITEMFFALDSELRFVYWNSACEQLTGKPASTVIGTSVQALFPTFGGSRSERTLLGVLADQQPVSYEYGDKLTGRHFEVNVFPSRIGLSVLLKEITLKKQKESQILELNQVLTQRNFELDQIVYKISHDIRSPLTSLLGLFNLMRLEPLEDQVKQYVQLAESRVNKLDQFTQTLLDYARASRLDTTYQVVDLKQVITESLQDLEHLPHYARMHFTVDIQGTDLYSDGFRLRIIFANLLGNAIKYQHPGREQSYLNISVQITGQQTLLVLEDNGIGIDEKYLPRIFDMFFRASEQSTGSGLGMYIVKQTVEKLGGSIGLESRLGIGTRITIQLPNLATTPSQEGALRPATGLLEPESLLPLA